jgi:hypothetical protein
VFPGSLARVGVYTDVSGQFRNWGNRFGEFVPVVAHRVNSDFASTGCRLPILTPLIRAAKLYGWAPVDNVALKAVLSQYRQLGPRNAGSLLSDWATAINESRASLGEPFTRAA